MARGILVTRRVPAYRRSVRSPPPVPSARVGFSLGPTIYYTSPVTWGSVVGRRSTSKKLPYSQRKIDVHGGEAVQEPFSSQYTFLNSIRHLFSSDRQIGFLPSAGMMFGQSMFPIGVVPRYILTTIGALEIGGVQRIDTGH